MATHKERLLMTQYYYISSPRKLPEGDFGAKPISEDKPHVFSNELDFTSLFFENNYDQDKKKRFSYVPSFHYKYQVAVYHNFLPIKSEERGNNPIERKCLGLFYDYISNAVEESGMIEYCTCLNGTEDRGDWTRKTLYWGDVESRDDLVLNDREICEIVTWKS